MATLRDFLGNAERGDGRKFKNKCFVSDSEWVEPFFKSNGGDWHCLTDNGESWNEDQNSPGWSEWAPTKAKVVRWKWAYKSNLLWMETDYFYTDDEAESYSKTLKKLEYTATEFEE